MCPEVVTPSERPTCCLSIYLPPSALGAVDSGSLTTVHACLRDPVGHKPRSDGVIRPGRFGATPAEELFAVYRKHHPHVVTGESTPGYPDRLAYAVGVHRNLEEVIPLAHLHGDPYHPSPPSRQGCPDRAGVSPEVRFVWELGRVAFWGRKMGEEGRRGHPAPRRSMARRRPRGQQTSECRSM